MLSCVVTYEDEFMIMNKNFYVGITKIELEDL